MFVAALFKNLYSKGRIAKRGWQFICLSVCLSVCLSLSFLFSLTYVQIRWKWHWLPKAFSDFFKWTILAECCWNGKKYELHYFFVLCFFPLHLIIIEFFSNWQQKSWLLVMSEKKRKTFFLFLSQFKTFISFLINRPVTK